MKCSWSVANGTVSDLTDAKTWPGGRSNGSYGFDVGRVRGRLYGGFISPVFPRLCLSGWQISCVDVFAMPQSGTTVTVESVDHVFQTKMLEMLKQTGRYVYLCLYYPQNFNVDCHYADLKWSLAGTILTQVSVVGCRALMSTHSK